MSFFARLFGRSTARTLRCKNCGEEYHIGVDSAIMTSDEVLRASLEGDSSLFGGNFEFPTDTVGGCEYASLPKAMANDIRKTSEEAHRRADCEPGRQWKCKKCSHRQKYTEEEAKTREQTSKAISPPAPSNKVEPGRAEPASIKITCVKCKKQLKVKATLTGKRIKCPGCGHSQIVAEAGSQSASPLKASVVPGDAADVERVAYLVGYLRPFRKQAGMVQQQPEYHELHQIGKKLNSHGGVDLMRKVAHEMAPRVTAPPNPGIGDQVRDSLGDINEYWDDIGEKKFAGRRF